MNGCYYDKLNKEKFITELEQDVDGITIDLKDIAETVIIDLKNPYEIKNRKNRSALQFNGDTYYTLYTETKFNRFQKFLWKHLLNINISDVEDK